MCLDHLDKTKCEWTTGYKVFRKDCQGILRGVFCDTSVIRPEEEWVKRERSWKLSTNDQKDVYDSGFHTFESLKAAKDWYGSRMGIVRKIKVRELLAHGMQDGGAVGVFKEMFILKEVK